MKLNVETRKVNKKSDVKSLRREGFIPAVLYVRGKEGETLTVKNEEFKAHLRGIKSGFLPTSIFSLVDSSGKTRRAIIKEIQYQPTNYNVIHLDFEEVVPNQKINLKVPVECVGANDSPGVKLGGVLRQVIRHLRVSCFGKDIPNSFELDVKDLAMSQSKRVADIKLPESIRPLIALNEVVAVIVKR